MKTTAIVLAAVMLVGCATAPASKAEWRQNPDGSWVGPATTYQIGSEPGHQTCNDVRYEWACNLDTYRRSVEDAARSINGMRR